MNRQLPVLRIDIVNKARPGYLSSYTVELLIFNWVQSVPDRAV
nr:MAG TPA: hypothetical protein [Caudoviricetes sp.]